MARLHTTGHSLRQIAATLDRAPSTVARELNRNASTTQGYQPGYADQQARARRWQGSKLDRDSTLRATVLARLQHGWSPQQVAGRLAREHHRSRSSPTRPSTASSTPRSPARKSTPGATICPGPKRNAAAVATKAVARRPLSPCAARWRSGRARSRIAGPPAIGRPT